MSDTETEAPDTTEPPTVEPIPADPGEDALEPTEAPETPAEDETGEGQEEAGEVIEGADDEPADDEGEPEQPTGQVWTDKERKDRDDKIDREHERHAKRIGEIMGDEAVSLIPCPVCMDGIDGWIYPPEVQQLPPEAISRIRTVIGLPDYTTFRNAPDAQECPDCGGLGEVITGSHVPGYETKTCNRCGKIGWVPAGQTGNGHTQITEVPVQTGPQVYGLEVTADPEVEHLRERGFTVIPPMPIASNP